MDLTTMAASLPDRLARQRRYLEDAGHRLTSSSAQELLSEASILTSALVVALNESPQQLKRGISQLDSTLASASSTFDEGTARLTTTAEHLASVDSERAIYSFTTLRTQQTLNSSYEIALKTDRLLRELLLSYYERWLEAVYCALGFFESEHQRDQLQTLLTVLIGMVPGVGTIRDLIDLSNALRAAAADPKDFKGADQFEQYSGSCRALLTQFEILADIAPGTAPIERLEADSFEARLISYRLDLGNRVDARIRGVIELNEVRLA